jgi:hypothetical protein
VLVSTSYNVSVLSLRQPFKNTFYLSLVNAPFLWIERRYTKLEEDKVYSKAIPARGKTILLCGTISFARPPTRELTLQQFYEVQFAC